MVLKISKMISLILSGLLVVILGVFDSSAQTGEARPNFRCPAYFECSSKAFGNYKLETDPGDSKIKSQTLANGDVVFDYFVSCAASGTWCMACAPANTWFDMQCNKCLFLSSFSVSYPGRCPVPTWPTPTCPELTNSRANSLCASKGGDYSGNLAHFLKPNPSGGPPIPNDDRVPTRIFLTCWKGQYKGCLYCQEGLLFKEGVNWKGEPDMYGHCS